MTPARADDLYRAQTAVTGQGEPNRLIGFAACLEDVLIKVSGALQLAGDARLEPFKSRAADFVTAFDYHDQMSGKPKRDEQGTRDRPYDLIVDFDKSKIDELLGSLGLKPWLSHRPTLGIIVAMVAAARSFIVTADGRQSDLQRDSARIAASRRGMTILLPDEASVAKLNVGDAALMTAPVETLAPLVAAQGPEAILIGRLAWDDDDLGWVTEWRLDADGRSHRWKMRGVTFDEAFRRGIGGAAQVLSGNGDPG
ncbi:DUF2066 domain-containing protein [Bradyrhizobium sp. STM 3557]|uniref:DUF2066 domain-containing protein n=1 Tax=Bradyrhizobium sp. STM 3557 TaxID=578920 RepID=UPI00388F1536